MDTKYLTGGPVGLVGGGVAGALLGGVVGSKFGRKKSVAPTVVGATVGAVAFGLVGVVVGDWYEENRTELAALKALTLPSLGTVERMFAPSSESNGTVKGAKFP